MPTPTTDAVRSPTAAGAGEHGRTWSIAEVAEEFGVTHRTVRHYEELGLISPERRGTTRVYHRRDRTRLGLILRGKRLGFPLEEIRTIIDLYDVPRGRRSQLEYVLGQIDERRTDLEQRRRDLDAALAELTEFERRCRSDLDALGERPSGPAAERRERPQGAASPRPRPARTTGPAPRLEVPALPSPPRRRRRGMAATQSLVPCGAVVSHCCRSCRDEARRPMARLDYFFTGR